MENSNAYAIVLHILCFDVGFETNNDRLSHSLNDYEQVCSKLYNLFEIININYLMIMISSSVPSLLFRNIYCYCVHF